MIITGKMKHLTGAVLHSDSEAVTREMLRLGVLDFISFQDNSAEWKNSLEPVRIETEQSRLTGLRERIETLFGVTGSHPSAEAMFVPEDEGFSASFDETGRRLDKIAAGIQRVREEQRLVSQELNRIKELHRHLSSPGPAEKHRQGQRFIEIRFGHPQSGKDVEFRSALEPYPSVYLENGMLMSLKRDEAAVKTLLNSFGWVETEPVEEKREEPGIPDREIEEKKRELQARNSELERKAKEIVEKEKEALLQLWKEIRIRELSGTISGTYGKTAKTFIFSGWVPADYEKKLDTGIRKASGNRCYLEWRTPLSGENKDLPRQVPVIMNNPSWLRPFEKLVTNYAVPAYGTVDPTIFVALFYCAMFGLMFGDVGHGLVVFLIGFAGRLKGEKSGRKDREHFLFPLFRWCGVSAMIAGLLFGSWFGFQLFPPLWFDYHGIVNGHQAAGSVKTITDILLITIYFGIIVIALGLLLNWYNRLVRRDWIGLILDKGGLVGGWMYAAGTWAAFRFVRSGYRELPDSALLAMLLGVPALLMGLKPVLEWRYYHKRERFTAMTAVNLLMEWIVELLEVFSGYLSNTLSFMRVAGLGIAHVSLVTAFFQIADMAAGPGGYSLWSIIILILGHALIIGLEGLSAGIQSLRLNYYEFFSRYFDGSGRAYAPVTLKH
jgi:V/A-type H+/Na+-transporting ATPase subunit I